MKRYALIAAPGASGKTTFVRENEGRWGDWHIFDSGVIRDAHGCDPNQIGDWLAHFGAPDRSALLITTELVTVPDGLIVAAYLPSLSAHRRMQAERERTGFVIDKRGPVPCPCGQADGHAYRYPLVKQQHSLTIRREAFMQYAKWVGMPLFDSLLEALVYVDRATLWTS